MHLDTFTFIHDTENHTHETVLKDGELYATWPAVLEQFLVFLEVCYGYPIRDRVEVNDPMDMPFSFPREIEDDS
jgi:hypothetical protein